MKITRTIIIALFIICFTAIGFAQPPTFGGNNGPDTPNDAEPTPISGLVFIGIAAGAVIGYRKLKA